jgi:hypothetical protein
VTQGGLVRGPGFDRVKLRLGYSMEPLSSIRKGSDSTSTMRRPCHKRAKKLANLQASPFLIPAWRIVEFFIEYPSRAATVVTAREFRSSWRASGSFDFQKKWRPRADSP